MSLCEQPHILIHICLFLAGVLCSNCEGAAEMDVVPVPAANMSDDEYEVVRMPSRRSVLSNVTVYEAANDDDPHRPREWIIQLPTYMNTETLNQWGARFSQASDGEMMWAGHPSEGGMSNLFFRGSKAALARSMGEVAGAMWVEEAFGMEALGNLQVRGRPARGRRLAEQAVDERFWGLDRIDSEVGLDGTYNNFGLGGEGVHVYVLDSGIRATHFDFGGRAVPEVDFVSQQLCSGNPFEDCARDRNGHGTFCAGIVAGGIAGVAKGSIVHGVKVLGDDGRGSTLSIIRAVDYVARFGRRPAVVSMSLGCRMPCESPTMSFVIEQATESGLAVVVAAGNAGNTNVSDACEYSPADAPKAITVGSITINNDTRSGFSNTGSCVDIFAPGSDILSAYAFSDRSGAILSGTSFACPHVSGAAALLLGQAPDLRPSEIKDLIINGSVEGNVLDALDSPNRLLFIGGFREALLARGAYGQPHEEWSAANETNETGEANETDNGAGSPNGTNGTNGTGAAGTPGGAGGPNGTNGTGVPGETNGTDGVGAPPDTNFTSGARWIAPAMMHFVLAALRCASQF
mmetsp:Transcript_52461/g.147750  ORF Transcript_52461/g.147750 Transcript_52461/m.147750 type:complete len:574 (-) Transcript_52461:46-1767(-)